MSTWTCTPSESHASRKTSAEEAMEQARDRGAAVVARHEAPRMRARHAAATSARARVKTASSIGSVSLPVKVFCWLGW